MEVVIIGAGIAGLSLAEELSHEPSLSSIVVLEAAPKVGGGASVQSTTTQGTRFTRLARGASRPSTGVLSNCVKTHLAWL